MTLSTLNDDILRIIAEMLFVAQCIPLSIVSRDLHAITRQYVFASITIRSEEQLVKMHDHPIRNVDNRLIWPRELTIYGPTENARWECPAIDALVGIFEHTRELKALGLHWSEAMIDCDARIGEHLAALPNLSDIRLLAVGPTTLAVLCKMVSRLEKACLSSTMFSSNRTLRYIAKAAVLGNVKRLRLRNFQFIVLSELQLLPKLAGAHPQLEVLDLDRSAVYSCLILFPNLRRLTILNSKHNGENRLQRPGHPVEQRHLNYLSVEPTYLHLIPSLGIHSDYLRLVHTESQDFSAIDILDDFVRTAAVLELSLNSTRIECYTGACTILARKISAEVSKTRYFILTTQWQSYSASRWMQTISSSLLSSSQILCIRVHVTHPNEGEPSRETWLALLQRLQSVHISSVPSLRFYFQHIEGTDNPRIPSVPSFSTWGRVEGDGGDRTLQPIPNWQGERIHRYLQSPEFCRTLHFDEETALQYSGR
ncbi:uncharacterized protein B0H18DRAFT_1120122 [Fomitopsis serialis]|uniref:uncharacterized protein n=1 Tax=Fomitopsis serialis TaxID=139415 RepID=UPI0020085A79|nr:uncharacterized protein B0H18DRAFT_1120122 [Neoantrodia serialis]KAH9924047.1 hypothetical protein B0H18DRAFT_1120122 [Neoantrodia serialis]